VSGHPGLLVPGWLAVQTVRHVESLAELNDLEAAALGPTLRSVSDWLMVATRADRSYQYALGETVRHVHVLVGVPLATDDANGRGGRLLTRILQRDPSLIDGAASADVLARVRAVARKSGPRGQPTP